MAKTQGFPKVVRASVVTPRKQQISKFVAFAIVVSGIIRTFHRAFSDPTTHECSYKRALGTPFDSHKLLTKPKNKYTSTNYSLDSTDNTIFTAL